MIWVLDLILDMLRSNSINEKMMVILWSQLTGKIGLPEIAGKKRSKHHTYFLGSKKNRNIEYTTNISCIICVMMLDSIHLPRNYNTYFHGSTKNQNIEYSTSISSTMRGMMLVQHDMLWSLCPLNYSLENDTVPTGITDGTVLYLSWHHT